MSDQDTLLEQVHFRAIFENQKEKLIESFNGNLIYPHNGGFFMLGAPLFFELKMNIEENKTSAILLDINLAPIEITNLKEFFKNARSDYTEALNRYHLGLARLKKSRMIPTLIKLHDLEDDIEE